MRPSSSSESQLQSLLEDLLFSLDQVSAHETLARFTVFARALHEQLRAEDEFLTQAEALLSGDTQGIPQLRSEQEPLRQLLFDIERGLTANSGTGAVGNLCELRASLTLHLKKLSELSSSMRKKCV